MSDTVPEVGISPPHAWPGTKRAVSHGTSRMMPGQMSSAPAPRCRRSRAAGAMTMAMVSQPSSSHAQSVKMPLSGTIASAPPSRASSVRRTAGDSGGVDGVPWSWDVGAGCGAGSAAGRGRVAVIGAPGRRRRPSPSRPGRRSRHGRRAAAARPARWACRAGRSAPASLPTAAPPRRRRPPRAEPSADGSAPARQESTSSSRASAGETRPRGCASASRRRSVGRQPAEHRDQRRVPCGGADELGQRDEVGAAVLAHQGQVGGELVGVTEVQARLLGRLVDQADRRARPAAACAPMLAAALTAHSRLLARRGSPEASSSPASACAEARRSSSTVLTARHGRSSWRTMRLPVRADDRQWILRRSSPVRYSRVDASSAPCAPTEWLPAEPPTSSERGGSTGGRSSITGVTTNSVVVVNDATEVDHPERVGEPDAQRADAVAAAAEGGQAVGHRPRLAAGQRVEGEPGPARRPGRAARPRA